MCPDFGEPIRSKLRASTREGCLEIPRLKRRVRAPALRTVSSYSALHNSNSQFHLPNSSFKNSEHRTHNSEPS